MILTDFRGKTWGETFVQFLTAAKSSRLKPGCSGFGSGFGSGVGSGVGIGSGTGLGVGGGVGFGVGLGLGVGFADVVCFPPDLFLSASLSCSDFSQDAKRKSAKQRKEFNILIGRDQEKRELMARLYVFAKGKRE